MRDWTPSAFMQASGAYWESCAIHAAVHLDLFSPLAGGALSADDLARRVDGDPRGVDMLITAMCGLGLMVRRGGLCELTPFSRRHLCRGASDYLGHMVEHHRDLLPGWTRLDEAVRAGRPVRARTTAKDPADRESFLMGMCNIANAQAGQSVPHIDLSGRSRLLDLGGATGIYAVHFCRRNPQLDAVVFDLPSSRPFAEKVIAEQAMAGRIRFHAGDFTKDPLPGGFDAAWLSQILHGAGPRESAAIVGKAARALNPGGLLLIQEFILDDDRNGPAHSALFSLNMLIGTPEGQSFTETELADLMTAAGAVDVRRLPLHLPEGCGVMAGTMPGK